MCCSYTGRQWAHTLHTDLFLERFDERCALVDAEEAGDVVGVPRRRVQIAAAPGEGRRAARVHQARDHLGRGRRRRGGRGRRGGGRLRLGPLKVKKMPFVI